MPNTRKQSRLRVVNLMIEAPARVIFASDDMTDEIRLRTNQTGATIHAEKTILGSVASVSDDLAITNILSDLRHYCDSKGLAFKKLDKAARALYLEEKAHEAPWQTPPG
jgi:dihydroorotase